MPFIPPFRQSTIPSHIVTHVRVKEVLIVYRPTSDFLGFRNLPADVLWGSFVTHSFLPVGEKWMRDKRTPKDVCGEATAFVH